MKPFRHYSGRFVTTTARTGVLAPEFPITLKIGWIQDVNMTNMHLNIFPGFFRFLWLRRLFSNKLTYVSILDNLINYLLP